MIPQTSDLLAAEEHERGRTTILVLDEAHLLTADQLEELRLLTLCRAASYAEVVRWRARALIQGSDFRVLSSA